MSGERKAATDEYQESDQEGRDRKRRRVGRDWVVNTIFALFLVSISSIGETPNTPR